MCVLCTVWAEFNSVRGGLLHIHCVLHIQIIMNERNYSYVNVGKMFFGLYSIYRYEQVTVLGIHLAFKH